MSEYVWIKKSGVMKEEMFPLLLNREYFDKFFLACSTDSFKAGHAGKEELCALKVENLLELRIFSKEQEVCFRRSRVGEDFQWRIAAEENVPENHYIVQYQTIDMNRKKSEAGLTDEYQNRILYTTGGGKYVLPVGAQEDSAKVIAYISYDNNGMGKIVDYRLCGFVELGKREEAELYG